VRILLGGDMIDAVAPHGIVLIQSLFFFLGGIRDNFMQGKVIMPDEEYLQSWWYETKLGDSMNVSPRMAVITNNWGTFIATIALAKMAVALLGGKTGLAKALAMVFILGNVWSILCILPMNGLMEAHWTDPKNKKLNPSLVNKGDVSGFCILLGIECALWLVATMMGEDATPAATAATPVKSPVGKVIGSTALSKIKSSRKLSLPKSVLAAGGMGEWNSHPQLRELWALMDGACQAKNKERALEEVRGLMGIGTEHMLLAYMYLRVLAYKNLDVYYQMLLADPGTLLPIAYTPTVGEACQKFGRMPFYPRGCYVSITDKGNVKAVLEEYAKEMLPAKPGGGYECQCVVFSDGGRILGLGDLGTFGMGIPMGKLDLYTVCGGFNPKLTVPLMIDVGCGDFTTNTAKMQVREHELYTGLKQDRVMAKSSAGTMVNTCYFGHKSFMMEFFEAATELFGKSCLLQFEDFNSNDAFPLLAEYRDKFLCYNDDIQGTAAVCVAGVLGGIKIQNPAATDLVTEARKLNYLFYGSGSANLGAAQLLHKEFNVPLTQIFITGSKGLIWKSADGTDGCFKNDEQKGLAHEGKPAWDTASLPTMISKLKPDVLVGAVGRAPDCFTKEVVEGMCGVQKAKRVEGRPIIFALSNPKTQAEITATNAYDFSGGKVIYGSGTRFPAVTTAGVTREPGQVNNFFIFPGMSFGAVMCKSKSIPETLFMAAAEAVALTLDAHDIKVESVVPHPSRIRDVNINVATAVVLKAQELGIAGEFLGKTADVVREKLKAKMWMPKVTIPKFSRQATDFGSCAHHEAE